MKTSESIQNLAPALVKFQTEVQNPKNTATNPFHQNKYAPLESVLNAVRPALTKNGLAIMQDISGTENGMQIITRIFHESGEWLESSPLCIAVENQKGVTKPQAVGIAVTYGRRYQLSAVLAINSEDDNDGNVPEGQEHSKDKKNDSANAQHSNTDISTDSQRKAIYAIANKKGIDIKTHIKKMYKKDSSKDLTKNEASELIEWLNSAEAEEEDISKNGSNILNDIQDLLDEIGYSEKDFSKWLQEKYGITYAHLAEPKYRKAAGSVLEILKKRVAEQEKVEEEIQKNGEQEELDINPDDINMEDDDIPF